MQPPKNMDMGNASMSTAQATAADIAKSKQPPPIPSGNVVVYDCLTGNIHRLTSQDLVFGSAPSSDVQLGAFGFKDGRIVLGRSGKRLQIVSDGGKHEVVVNGASFEGGLLPEAEELSLVIDKLAFFFIRVGPDANEWSEKMKSSSSRGWMLQILKGGMKHFQKWKKLGCPFDFPDTLLIDHLTILDVIEEVSKRSWTEQVGVIYHSTAKSGFFASQFKKLSQPSQLPDAGEHRCPRDWMRFDTVNVLAIHPSELGDKVLGESEFKRFLPERFGEDGFPLTADGVPCKRLACPHCRGELPPNLIEKAPHMLSIVGDSMAGKSYFLAVAVRQLKRVLPGKFGINFTDGDPIGNATLSKMIAKLFNPAQNPADTFIGKTQLAGATYKKFMRHGELVNLPTPFTYNLVSKKRRTSTMILYDNAGEHFRPGFSDLEMAATTEHIAWASGILFLFDPCQHRDLLALMDEKTDPQIKRYKNDKRLLLDQDVVLAEIAERVRGWRSLSLGEAHDVPLAVILGKHDLLMENFPIDRLTLDVCPNGKISLEAIHSNSEAARSFLLEHCPDIVGAAENISDRVMYFPASAFGSPAVLINEVKNTDGDPQIGPDTRNLKPYLIEAPFLWILSQVEPSLFVENR